MNSLIEIISKTFDANQLELNSALSYLNKIADEDFTKCILSLVELICLREPLVNNQPIVPYKLQSCLQLKNILSRKPDTWHGLPEGIKHAVRCSILSCYKLDGVRHIGLSQVVLAMAKLELPQNGWNDLIPSLLQLASVPDDGGSVAMQTLGYICEAINPDYLEAYNNQILTLLVHTIRRDDISLRTKLDGLNALNNSFAFAAANFARQAERNFLMQVICDSTQHIDNEIKILSLQCLCKALTLYYPLMDSYLAVAVWPIVMSSLSADNNKEEVVLQSLEVINSVCDGEIKLAKESEEDYEDCDTNGDGGDRESECLQPVLPQLLTSITQVFLSAGASLPVDWSVGQATQITLRMLTRASPNTMVRLLVPNILQNLGHTEVMVQSCVLTCTAALMEGTSSSQVLPVIQAFLDSIPVTLFNQNVKVRYHSGSLVVQLCLHQYNTLHSMGALDFLLPILNKALEVNMDDHVSEHMCWALRYLAENLEAEKFGPVVAPVFIHTAGLLYNLAMDEKNKGKSLEKVSYECLISWLGICPEECVQHLQIIIISLLDRAMFLPHYSPSLVYTCTAVGIILSKLPEDVLQHKCMLLFSQLCQLLKHKTGVEEETVVALTRILDRVPLSFLECPVQPLLALLLGITCIITHKNLNKTLTRDSGMMLSCIGLISDIYRASSDNQQVPSHQYSSQLIISLLQISKDPSNGEDVRSVSLGTVSDIILCIESNALEVIPTIIQVLASFLPVHPQGHPGHQLTKSIIETYSTIIQVFHQNNEFREEFISKEVDRIAMFIQVLYGMPGFFNEDEVMAVACGLIGDLCKYFSEAELSDYVASFTNILSMGTDSGESKTRRIARWARDQMSTGPSAGIVKKARIESDNCMETSCNTVVHQATASYRVSLSCSTSQFITQNIEESFTLNLSKKSSNPTTPTTLKTLQQDVNSNYVEATIRIPSRSNSTTVNQSPTAGDSSCASVQELRKLGKRRACFIGDNIEGKKLRDQDDNDESFW